MTMEPRLEPDREAEVEVSMPSNPRGAVEDVRVVPSRLVMGGSVMGARPEQPPLLELLELLEEAE